MAHKRLRPMISLALFIAWVVVGAWALVEYCLSYPEIAASIFPLIFIGWVMLWLCFLLMSDFFRRG